jgi:hypothetical protein
LVLGNNSRALFKVAIFISSTTGSELSFFGRIGAGLSLSFKTYTFCGTGERFDIKDAGTKSCPSPSKIYLTNIPFSILLGSPLSSIKKDPGFSGSVPPQ